MSSTDTNPYAGSAATEGPRDMPVLERFLADRDVPCPSCGYNLRGAVGEKCPECAHPLSLGVARPGPTAALTWFLMLAFGWVFAAGVMNSVRNSLAIQNRVESARAWGMSSTVVIRGGSPTGIPTYSLQQGAAPGAGFWSTAWGVVPMESWIAAAWAVVLALGCGIGLLLMAQRQTHPFTPAGDRRMVRLACTMFAIYATWHIVTFLLEFM